MLLDPLWHYTSIWEKKPASWPKCRSYAGSYHGHSRGLCVYFQSDSETRIWNYSLKTCRRSEQLPPFYVTLRESLFPWISTVSMTHRVTMAAFVGNTPGWKIPDFSFCPNIYNKTKTRIYMWWCGLAKASHFTTAFVYLTTAVQNCPSLQECFSKLMVGMTRSIYFTIFLQFVSCVYCQLALTYQETICLFKSV